MSKHDTFLLRIDPAILKAVKQWAADELRSANGQIEFLLREALQRAQRSPQRAAGDSNGHTKPNGSNATDEGQIDESGQEHDSISELE